MKAMVCEMCNSRDLVKQNGMYVCQYCGTKYDVAEARNLLVDIVDGAVKVTGTVKIDNSEQVAKYLELAKSAYSGEDYAGTVNYCDKALEIDAENVDAWTYKAKSACWIDATLNSMKIANSISAAKRAVILAPDAQKTEIADSIYWEIKKNIVALLNLSYKMPGITGCPYIHKIMTSWNNMLVEIPNLSNGLIEQEIGDCATLCKNSKSAFLPVKRLVYATSVSYNAKQSYDVTFRKSLGR